MLVIFPNPKTIYIGETLHNGEIHHARVFVHRELYLIIWAELREDGKKIASMVGQCLPLIVEYFPEHEKLREIYEVWKTWHLVQTIPHAVLELIASW